MTAQKQNFILRSTYEILQQRAKKIKEKLNTELPKRLRESYETGGYWHDNALWDEAMREQELLQRELLKLLDGLREITFIEDVYPLMDEDRVTIGKTVKVENVNTGEVKVMIKLPRGTDTWLIKEIKPLSIWGRWE